MTEAEKLAKLIAANTCLPSTTKSMQDRLIKMVGRDKALKMIKAATR